MNTAVSYCAGVVLFRNQKYKAFLREERLLYTCLQFVDRLYQWLSEHVDWFWRCERGSECWHNVEWLTSVPVVMRVTSTIHAFLSLGTSRWNLMGFDFKNYGDCCDRSDSLLHMRQIQYYNCSEITRTSVKLLVCVLLVCLHNSALISRVWNTTKPAALTYGCMHGSLWMGNYKLFWFSKIEWILTWSILQQITNGPSIITNEFFLKNLSNACTYRQNDGRKRCDLLVMNHWQERR